MFINIYSWDVPIRETCNFDSPLNNIFIGIDLFYANILFVSIKSHMINMMELQYNQFYVDPLYEREAE